MIANPFRSAVLVDFRDLRFGFHKLTFLGSFHFCRVPGTNAHGRKNQHLSPEAIMRTLGRDPSKQVKPCRPVVRPVKRFSRPIPAQFPFGAFASVFFRNRNTESVKCAKSFERWPNPVNTMPNSDCERANAAAAQYSHAICKGCGVIVCILQRPADGKKRFRVFTVAPHGRGVRDGRRKTARRVEVRTTKNTNHTEGRMQATRNAGS